MQTHTEFGDRVPHEASWIRNLAQLEVNLIGKRYYSPPRLAEYGAVGALTLGSGGSLPDYNTSFALVNNNCPTQTYIDSGVTYTRVACINANS